MTSDSTKENQTSTQPSKKEVLQNPILKKSHVHEKSEKAKRKQDKQNLRKKMEDDHD